MLISRPILPMFMECRVCTHTLHRTQIHAYLVFDSSHSPLCGRTGTSGSLRTALVALRPVSPPVLLAGFCALGVVPRGSGGALLSVSSTGVSGCSGRALLLLCALGTLATCSHSQGPALLEHTLQSYNTHSN